LGKLFGERNMEIFSAMTLITVGAFGASGEQVLSSSVKSMSDKISRKIH
jgi:hypothetical protein